jgi:YlmC/YmxH family sporulation protein
MRLSDLQRKDIINVNDGRIIGRIIDAEINEKDGSLDSLVIEKSKYIRNLFTSENDITIKYEQIKKLGSDVILIDI